MITKLKYYPVKIIGVTQLDAFLLFIFEGKSCEKTINYHQVFELCQDCKIDASRIFFPPNASGILRDKDCKIPNFLKIP